MYEIIMTINYKIGTGSNFDEIFRRGKGTGANFDEFFEVVEGTGAKIPVPILIRFFKFQVVPKLGGAKK